MSDHDTASRIRWKPQELQGLAKSMAAILAGKPGMTLLSALRQAQAQVIDEDRRREIKAWSVVQGKLDKLLEQAQEDMRSGNSTAGVEQAMSRSTKVVEAAAQSAADGQGRVDTDHAGKADAPDGTGRPLEGPGTGAKGEQGATAPLCEGQALQRQLGQASPAMDMGQMGAVLAGAVESALLVALQSPQVEEAFARVLASAMDKASTGNEGSRNDDQVSRAGQRVLLAGFPTQTAKGIEEELRNRFDVRRWSPNQGAQMLETLIRLCSVAVIPDEADEEMSEALKGRELQVVRHGGNAQRLSERLSMMIS